MLDYVRVINFLIIIYYYYYSWDMAYWITDYWLSLCTEIGYLQLAWMAYGHNFYRAASNPDAV